VDTFAMVPPAELGELAMDPPDPLPLHLAHQMLTGVPEEAIDEILRTTGPGSDAPVAMVQLRHAGGALGRVSPGAGARATIPGEIVMVSLGVTPDEDSSKAVRAALHELEQAVLPWRAGDYPNFVEHPTDASSFFDEATWQRLRQVKAQYDPDNLFRGNHQIPPAEAALHEAA
jgi:FAD/FMN-containing dehydrogenase